LPTLSVGNLTAGGTGKTPLVIHLARALAARGERPGVLARGYGAPRDGELNDELRLVAAEVPEAVLAPGRDRVARAAEARDRGATFLLLDDGFQHRRLARHADVVLLDATEPWGPGAALLPRGLLREPPGALRRADAVVLSRAEQAAPEALARLEAAVRALGFAGPVVRLLVAPRALRPLPEGPAGPPAALAGRAVWAACGIGNPAAFRRTLADLGADVRGLSALDDHHAWTGADVERVTGAARAAGAGLVVVTTKDGVKLRAPLAGAPPPLPWAELAVAAALDPEEATDTMIRLAQAPGADADGR